MLSFGETSESEQLKIEVLRKHWTDADLRKRDAEKGREYQHDAYVIPTDEICAALGIPVGSVTELKKACYGLVDAPLEWFLRLSEYVASIRFTRCVTDPCCFKYVNSKGDLVGLISGHVDDFLFCGREECAEWKQLW